MSKGLAGFANTRFQDAHATEDLGTGRCLDALDPGNIPVRSQDGASWPVEYGRLQSLAQLQDALASQLEIGRDALILMHQEGWQLDNAAWLGLVAELGSEGSGELSMSRSRASSHSKAVFLFAFNRDHLDADLDQLEHELRLDRSQVLQEPLLPSFSSSHDAQSLAASHAQTASNHLHIVRTLLDSLRLQRQSLQVAIANLERHQSSKQGGAEMFTVSAAPQLDRYAALLDAYPKHMELLSRIRVLPSLVGSSAAQSMTADRRTVSESHATLQPPPSGHSRATSTSYSSTTKDRYLSGYVSRTKIDSVKDECTKVFYELQEHFSQLREVLDGVALGTEHLLVDFKADNLDDLDDCEKDSVASKERVEAVAKVVSQLSSLDHEALADAFAELAILESEFRERILYLVARKNAVTRNLVTMLQAIAALQSDLSQTPAYIKQLDTDLRTRCEGFKHLIRLENIAPCYAITVVEVFRRRSYSSELLQQSTDLANGLSKLAASELKRRSGYRIEVLGQLPWEIRGLDAGLEHVELDMRKGQTGPLGDQELPDVSRQDVDDLIDLLYNIKDGLEEDDPTHPVFQTIDAIDRSLKKLGLMQTEFAKLFAVPEETSGEEVRAANEAREALERTLQRTKADKDQVIAELQAKVAELEQQTSETTQEAETAQARRRELEVQLRRVEQSTDALKISRKHLESQLDEERRQHAFTRDDASRQREALQEGRESSEREMRALQQKMDALADIHDRLLSDHQDAVKEHQTATDKLGAAQATIASLQGEQVALRSTLGSEEAAHAATKAELALSVKEVEELRANIEQMQKQKDAQEQELRDLKTEYQMDKSGLEEQLEGLRAVITETEEDSTRRINALLSELEAAQHAQISASTQQSQAANGFEALFHAVAEALKLLDEDQASNNLPKLDHSDLGAQGPLVAKQLIDGVNAKLTANQTLINRWHKECKFYRHKAKSAGNDKLAFRSFAKGDLCLFLPTAKTTSVKPIWAAFNSGVPHCFLKMDAEMEEQIKSKTWLVARIVTMDDYVAGPRDTESNPYNVEPGMKFYILSTEPWSASLASANKLASPASSRRKTEAKGIQATLPTSPPTQGSPAVVTTPQGSPSNGILPSPAPPAAPVIPIPIKAPSANTPPHTGTGSPVFTDPDSPTAFRHFSTPPSGLSKALQANEPSSTPPSGAAQIASLSDAKLEEAETGQLPPLSSSPSPAFLPARSIAGGPSRMGRPSGLTKSMTYPAKLGYQRRDISSSMSSSSRQPPIDGSVASIGGEASPGRRQGSSRSSHSISDGISAAARGRRPSVTGQGRPTMSTSFVSSLGRSSGNRAKEDVSGMESLRASSASIDLLNRFKKAVEQTSEGGTTFRKK